MGSETIRHPAGPFCFARSNKERLGAFLKVGEVKSAGRFPSGGLDSREDRVFLHCLHGFDGCRSCQVNEVARSQGVFTKIIVPFGLGISLGVIEAVGAGANADDGFARLQITRDMPELLVIKLEEAGVEDANVGICKCFEPGETAFVFFGIPFRIDNGGLETQALQFGSKKRHRFFG